MSAFVAHYGRITGPVPGRDTILVRTRICLMKKT